MEEDIRGPTEEEIEAVRVIERTWCSYRDRQMFKLLKYAICAAEHSITYEILRKVTPTEAELLKDPTVQARVRFRFGGSEFPPVIMFKVFIHSGGKGVKYINGKRAIKAASQAAVDACNIMGNRQFYDQITADICQHEQDKITDEIDVTTMRDYMQYLSHVDECPARIGGKANFWRKLTLDAIPRHNIVYDVVSYVNTGRLSPKLREELPLSIFIGLPTQEDQIRSINTITDYRHHRRKRETHSSGQPTARRSRQAKQRVARMRKMYGLDEEQSSTFPDTSPRPQDTPYDDDDLLKEEDWEEQAGLLYEWTQQLTLDELEVKSP